MIDIFAFIIQKAVRFEVILQWGCFRCREEQIFYFLDLDSILGEADIEKGEQKRNIFGYLGSK